MMSHRHTIMNGRVVKYAEKFELGGVSRGSYEVSASRDAVVIHRGYIYNQDDKDALLQAVELAYKMMRSLRSCNGRPDDNDNGEPRIVETSG